MNWPILLLAVVVCSPASAETIVIGSKKFTESVILGEIVRLKMTSHEAEHREQLGGTRVLWSALERGDIHAYPEYTGTIAEEIFRGEFAATDLKTMRARLAEVGVLMSDPLGFENTYAIGMLETRATELGITSISDLKKHTDISFGFANEFLDREDGWKSLRMAYNLGHKNVKGLDHDLAYKGLKTGSFDAMDIYTTDAEIPYYEIRALTDDIKHFPNYDAVLLYRSDKAEEFTSVLPLKITPAQMQQMNRAVKIDKRTEIAVAEEFLNLSRSETDSIALRILRRTFEHLEMVGISLLLAILLSIPLGVFAFRRKEFSQPILSTVGILQTIPSLALLVFMIPLLGIGTLPAIVALFLYSLLPIVRNTYAGFAEISPAIRRAAAGIGLTPAQILRQVELPLAARSILAGIKTAAVINVGTATLGALIGAGGYGQPILTGIRLDNTATVLEGAIPAAALALLVQFTFDLVEKHIVSPGLTTED